MGPLSPSPSSGIPAPWPTELRADHFSWVGQQNWGKHSQFHQLTSWLKLKWKNSCISTTSRIFSYVHTIFTFSCRNNNENLSNRRESEIFPSYYFKHRKEELLLVMDSNYKISIPFVGIVAIFERIFSWKAKCLWMIQILAEVDQQSSLDQEQ